VRSVPNVDVRIDQCAGLVGDAATSCWAALDKYLMQELVPWVPFMSTTTRITVSARIARMSFDQFTAVPALDQISLKPPGQTSRARLP
jgi:hypothetical protein